MLERLLELHARWPERYPALLESAARSEKLGRYDLLFALPQAVITKKSGESFLDTFDREFLREASAPGEEVERSLPFSGGWVVLLGYEIASEVEPRLILPPSPDPIIAMTIRVPAAVIYDHQAARLHVVAERGREDLLDEMTRDLDHVESMTSAATRSPRSREQGWGERFIVEDPPERFLNWVRRVKEYIAAGDVYQVNLSRAWSIDLMNSEGGAAITPADLYRSLRASNPAPFAASLVMPEWAVLSSSPERLFCIRWVGSGREIATRPIAGTRPRSRVEGADARETAGLTAHRKERAEHVMLVDLERNDLGKICTPGSVEVDELMALESYAHVYHLVSNVHGRLRDGVTPARVLRALFPGGTITGCPKVRCMQIIAELERVGRGAYTGSIGYLNHDGSGDFNILIRSLTFQRSTGQVRFRAGAGIVADSDAEYELEETRAKARGLLRAFGDYG